MSQISVILCVYNGSNYLNKSVTSVLQQEFQDFEFLILDNGSTDDTWAYLQSLKDERIRLYRNEKNSNVFFNLNFLIKESKNSIIKLWSHDDIMYPYCLSGFVNFHQQHPHIGFSYSERDMIDENGTIKAGDQIDNTPEIISPELHAKIAYYTGSIAGNIANVCVNRKALDDVGLFNESMKISADFDMWVRLAKEHDTGFIKKKLIQLRDHGGQLSRNEKYFINHVKEDLVVYRYLDSYVESSVRLEGKNLMRKHKLVFYYTLMIKALLKGKIAAAFDFYTQLSTYDNFFLLSFSFLKSRLRRPKTPALFHAKNAF